MSHPAIEHTTKTASFLIRIMYRQNCSWQGSIQWLDTNKTCHFRSVLELLLLLEQALHADDHPELPPWAGQAEVSYRGG